MAGRPPRIRCFVCDIACHPRNMVRIDGEDNNNILKREIAVTRRDGLNHPPLQIHDQSILCTNCNISITNEIAITEEDPTCLKLNVIKQTANRRCVICHDQDNLQRLSMDCRVNVFAEQRIYIPENVRCCRHHLDEYGMIPTILLHGLPYINRPIVIKGNQMLPFLNKLADAAAEKTRFVNEKSLKAELYPVLTSLTKEQFDDMFIFCDPAFQNGKVRYVCKKDLLMFLCKLRQGLSDEFLSIIFDYSSRQTVSSVIHYVRISLIGRFVPGNIGPRSITRHNYIAQHVTEFSNILYNPHPNDPKAIAIVDSTYCYIHKSSNFRVLRQSYSFHKQRHLLKPTLVVAPDGFILDIFGPYFSDSRNNDAEILRHNFEEDGNALRDWFENGDIMLVDRGYRDARQLLEILGIQCEMPAVLLPGQRQLSTEDANASRIVTKNRWVVESRNGHFRSVFKFFKDTLNLQHAKHLDDFYKIGGAILNRYHPMIHMEGANAQTAQHILERAQIPNDMQTRVEVDNLIRRNGQWRRINHNDVPEFPVLDLQYLKHFTTGVYQVNLAASYIQDRIIRENEDNELQIDEHMNEPGFLRVRVYSRFRNSAKHQVFISFSNNDGEDENDPITGYYCTCQSGARTLGSCAHVASIVWFLGYARYDPNVKYPDDSLLNTILDAAGRNNIPADIDIVE